MILQWRGSRGGGQARWFGGRKYPSEVQGQSHGGEHGGLSPPVAKAKCEISVHFYVFLYKILDLMNIRAGLGEYILQIHTSKQF